MESKHQEKIKAILRNLDNHGNSAADLYEHNDVVNAMCQLAEEVEKGYSEIIGGKNELIISQMFTIRNKYSKEQVEELQDKSYWQGVDDTEDKYNITNPNEKYLSISEIEELLDKQRKLSVERAKVKLGRKGINHPLAKQYWIIDEESILNSKLNIEDYGKMDK